MFTFYLASHLKMTVAELLTRMSVKELNEWAVFFRLQPFGPIRDNFHAGIIASTAANLFNSKGQALTPADFMPDFFATATTKADRMAKMKADCHNLHQQMVMMGMKVKGAHNGSGA